MANFLLQIVLLIVGAVHGLFQHDDTTGSVSVQFWAVVATVLLLLKFAAGSFGPRLYSRRLVAPVVQLLVILNYYAVNYTLGLMKPPSSDGDGGAAATTNNFFQVWAVLITTMQESIQIGRPYKPKEMSLIDLLSSLWSANQLRAPAPTFLKVPLWSMWSIHAARIIWYYISFNQAGDASLDNIKLVSDYMMTSQHTDDDEHRRDPPTMRGYKYIVFGEDEQIMEVRQPGFTLEMDLDGPNADRLITLEKIWMQADQESGDMLLSSTGDPDNQFKDVCLSFALYKLQRRRFYNFPIAEAMHPATSQLVSKNILMWEEATPSPAAGQPPSVPEERTVKRAFRITEVELSFLHDLFYSKHAAVFARGFPYVRLVLSVLMTAAALYLVYAVRDLPSVGTAVTRGGLIARITHGVFVTHCIIAVLVCRELWEVGVYVVSQWTKVWIIGRHMKLTRCLKQLVSTTSSSETQAGNTASENWYQRMMSWALEQVKRCQISWFVPLQLAMLHMVARIMFVVVKRGEWNRKIGQYNILMSDPSENKKVKVQGEVAGDLFQTLKDLIDKIRPPPTGQGSNPSDAWNKEMNKLLRSYFKNAFTADDASSSSTPTPNSIKDPADELQGETHKILVWHIATSLCLIKLKEAKGRDAAHYVTAVSLSNHCAYLVTQALVPDNGLVVHKVFRFVREEVREALHGCRNMSQIPGKLGSEPQDDATILGMGRKLSEELVAKYGYEEELWKRLAKFWAGFLLHLSASTRAAKHLIHLQGRGELTTHLWVLLSHAGFLGGTSHGEQLLDPVDRNDA